MQLQDARHIVEVVKGLRDSCQHHFSLIIRKIRDLKDGVRHYDVEALPDCRLALVEEDKSMRRCIETLIFQSRQLWEFDRANGTYYSDDLRDDDFGQDWFEELRVLYITADALYHWFYESIEEEDATIALLLKDCIDTLNRLLETISMLSNGSALPTVVEYCHVQPITVNITNMTERHFHFKDRVTYIENQQITVEAGGVFNNGPAAVEAEEADETASPTTEEKTTDTVSDSVRRIFVSPSEELKAKIIKARNQCCTKKQDDIYVYKVCVKEGYIKTSSNVLDFVRALVAWDILSATTKVESYARVMNSKKSSLPTETDYTKWGSNNDIDRGICERIASMLA